MVRRARSQGIRAASRRGIKTYSLWVLFSTCLSPGLELRLPAKPWVQGGPAKGTHLASASHCSHFGASKQLKISFPPVISSTILTTLGCCLTFSCFYPKEPAKSPSSQQRSIRSVTFCLLVQLFLCLQYRPRLTPASAAAASFRALSAKRGAVSCLPSFLLLYAISTIVSVFPLKLPHPFPDQHVVWLFHWPRSDGKNLLCLSLVPQKGKTERGWFPSSSLCWCIYRLLYHHSIHILKAYYFIGFSPLHHCA